MLYHYLASDKNGRLAEGDIDAERVGDVLQYLAGKELRPVAVKAMDSRNSVLQIFRGKITVEDKMFITRYLSLMLRVGTDLLSAINILIADFEKPAVKNLLLEIRDNLSHGKQFHEAFANHPNEFSKVFVNLVKAAEVSGNLQETFEELSVSLEEEAELHNKIKSAFTYPIILLFAALALFIFLSTFALPRIAKIFMETGIRPPLVSRVVFGAGLFVNDNIIVLVIALVVLATTSFYFFFKNPTGRRVKNRILSNMPFVKGVYKELAVQRFASTFSSLLQAGLPIIDATKITADVVGADNFRTALLRVADEGLAKGRSVGEAFKRETIFPQMVTNLIAVSEKVGHLEQVLKTLANFYATNVSRSVRSLITLLEPILLMIMGLVVGGIALSIIVPIYQLTSQF